MEKRKLTDIFKYNNNSIKIPTRSSSRKSVTLRPRINAGKYFENINNNFLEKINENSELKEKSVYNNNYSSSITKDNDEQIKVFKRRGTESSSSLLINSFYKKTLRNQKIINKDYVFAFLLKNPNSRKEQEINSVAKYLSDNYQYFTNLKNVDSQLKVERLAKIIKLEKFNPGENIINFGEIGDKFYIVLEGFVEIYKPFFDLESLTKNEFIQILNRAKNVEKDEKKYLRIKRYNKERKNIDISEYENIDSYMKFMNIKEEFYVEKLENLGRYGEGFSFGEMALIKNCQRNATIKSVGASYESTILLSIDKESYNQAIKEYQEKKILKEVESFSSTYPFIKNFNKDKILKIFNCMNRKILEKEEFLFHQNDKDDNLYFIINGTFSMSIDICYLWLNDYIDYIYNMKDNILGYLYVKKPSKFSQFFEIMEKLKEKKSKSPMIFDKYYLWEKMEDKKNENNLIGIKNDEEKLNSCNNIYKLHIKNIDKPILFGIEDSFEFKNKFYTIKCISDKAEVKSIKLIDFMKIIFTLKEDDLLYLLEIILRRKQMIKDQIIQSVNYLSNQIINKLEFKYETLLNTERITKKEKERDKMNKIVSLIKMKGYKNSIQDILDSQINFLGGNSQNVDDFENKKNKPQQIEDIIRSKKWKAQFKKIDKYKNNKENILILKRILKVNKMNKNIKKLNKEELNLSSFNGNKNISDLSSQKPLSDRKKVNNFSTINSNSETNIGNNTINNLLNTTHNFLKNRIFHKTIYDDSQSSLKKNSNYSFNSIKLLKQNKKMFKYYKNNSTKSYKNIFKSPISFKNYFNNKLYNFTQRDFLPKKLISKKILGINSSSKEKNKKFNGNTSEIYINDKGLNKKEFKKSYIDSKDSLSKNNTLYGYIDNNKDFYLCNNFSKKFNTIFEYKPRDKKHIFPLINKENVL